MPRLKAVLVASITAGALLFGAAPLRPALSAVTVNDPAANASLITQIKHQVTMLSNLAAQIAALTNLVSLASVAGTLLGDTVDPELRGLFTDLNGAYTNSYSAYGSIMRVPANINYEVALFREPTGGWASLTFPELVRRAEKIRRLTDGTNAAAVAQQADLIERRAYIAAQAARANGMSDRSISALSAAQAVAQQGRVASMILQNIEKTNNDIATTMALKAEQQFGERELSKQMIKLDIEGMRTRIASEPGQMDTSPILWGE